MIADDFQAAMIQPVHSLALRAETGIALLFPGTSFQKSSASNEPEVPRYPFSSTV